MRRGFQACFADQARRSTPFSGVTNCAVERSRGSISAHRQWNGCTRDAFD
jgi:hypothetical protein